MTIPSGDNNLRISSAEEIYKQEKENDTSSLQGRVKRLAARFLEQAEEKAPLALTEKKISQKQSSLEHKGSLAKVEQVGKQHVNTGVYNEDSIKQKLQNLHSMTPGGERAFIGDLSLHVSQLPTEQQQGAKYLLKILQALQNPHVFTMSQEEKEVVSRFSKKAPQLAINGKAYMQARQQMQQEMIQELKVFLAGYKGPLKDLGQAIEEKLNHLYSAAIPGTLKKIVQQKIPQKVGSGLTKMVESLQDFKQGALRYFEDRWAKDLQHLDKHYAGTPSKIMKELEYLSPVTSMQEREWDEELHEAFFAWESLPDTTQANTVYAKLYKESRDSGKGIMEWVATHATHIKKVYNQGADVHRNMGEGTCLMNSLERYKLLLGNPKLSAASLPLGSSLQGRMQQKWLDEEMKQVSKNPEKWNQLEKKLYAKMGLSLSHRYPIDAGVQGLEKKLNKLSSQGESIFALHLQPRESGPGHTFNIQYDPQRSIFRLIDDNLGIVECPNKEVFIESLCSWLLCTYPDFPLLTLKTFTSA